MKMQFFKKTSVFFLALVLIAAMALFAGCTTDQQKGDGASTTTTTTASQTSNENELGTGKTTFSFVVTKLDKTSKTYTIHTDKTTVGAALLEVGLIAGSDSEYGLMVETVDGLKLEYNADKAYWAFYVDGEYAMTGVDSTNIEAGKVYGFTATPA